MASYQVRQRDPLVDPGTQAALERRGRELLGVGLIVVAALFAAMLASYSPEDPGWMVATDEPARNWLGRFGASVASTLMIIGGKGAWGIPVILLAWGARFVLHQGEDRAMGRMVFAVIAVAMCSVFAATHVPGADWPHSFGLGGLFGDTVLGAVLGLLPIGAGAGLKILSLISGLVMVALVLFVAGCDRAELAGVLRFLSISLVTTYSALLGLAGRGAAGTARAAASLQERQRQRREQAASHAEPADWMAEDAAPVRRRGFFGRAEPAVTGGQPALAMTPEPLRATRVRRAEPVIEPWDDQGEPYEPAAPGIAHPMMAQAAVVSAPPEKKGLLARIRRAVEPSPVADPVETEQEDLSALSADERIRARINSVIRTRARQGLPTAAPTQPMTPIQAAIARREPAMMRPRGPQPLMADTARNRGLMVAEPPLTAAHAAATAPVVSGLRATRSVADVAVAAAAGATQPPASPSWGTMALTPSQAVPPHVAAPSTDPRTEWDDADEPDDDMDAMAQWELEAEDELPVMAPPPLRAAVQFDTRRVVQAPAKKPVAPSRQAMAEAQPRLRFEEPKQEYELPPLSLLASPSSIQRHTLSEEALEENARMLESVLDDYGVKGEIVSVRPGPVVTQYELEPAPGLKASRVIGLADDIARSMSALSARVSTVPGRSVIGIELPNAHREKVVLREILAARDFGDSNMRLPLALGKDIGGDPIVANLAKMPHLLIAGTTGSGKSVAINTMILSLLYKLTPEECRLIMIDPKMLELSVYDGIPHLLSPVVTDPKKAVVALKWVVGEMEERYRKMSKMGVRNIEGYNGRVREALAKGEMFKRTIQTGFDEDTGEPVFETEEFAPQLFPYIVVIVDEMADLMMVAGKEIEACIQRLAQMARASGIHLIMATQRPSVDVITGTIKANFPTRISFQVTSKIDSRTILGEQGAEQLLGMGDMLYMAGGARITRIHGPFVSDEEVEEIVNHLKSFGPPSYMSGVVEGPEDDRADDIDAVLGLNTGGNTDGDDALYDQAVAIVAKDRKCSTSYIQRKLGIGYNKAARLVEQMEENGVVTPANHVGKREILLPEQ
ncbi:cell division protein FtsK [Aliigemmobacter aestuarii]|uniref:DNA translocase FtsK n=1 Tax=Aliigemmobacter aestuarii TaxID=1445661 RepID=A0A4S3MMZ0_9RHOB|nr:DNA translocase FtsK [Gemmobacter aestuarii]THD83689.1 cell division protein FtsK [Gemmobacter aestuarii]